VTPREYERYARAHDTECDAAVAADLRGQLGVPEVTDADVERMLRESAAFLAWVERAKSLPSQSVDDDEDDPWRDEGDPVA
jgi:hypothetical protein